MDHFKSEFFCAVYNGDVETVNQALERGQAVDAVDEQSGMQALHIATGRDNLALVKLLTQKWNASFGPDREGRWPSLIAAICRVSDETSDYVFAAEAKMDAGPSLQAR